MKKDVILGLIQHRHSLSGVDAFNKTVESIVHAAAQGANIICTQELFKTEYFCQTENYDKFLLAEIINNQSSTIRQLSEVARRQGVVIIASLFEKQLEGLYYNTAVVIDADGSMLGKYRKMHIPDDPHFYEKFYFTPGDSGYKVFNTRYGTIGVLICWDQWFPEAARITALQGAQALFYPTAIGWLPSDKEAHGKAQHSAWETIQRSHAISNGCYVASINRVGYEPSPDGKGGIEFWGQSFVADTMGNIIAKASDQNQEVMIVPINLETQAFSRIHWPFLRDRRIESYGPICNQYIDQENL